MPTVVDADPRVMNRLRKIQALAERAGTEGEAQAALIAFQNLLTKHNLSASDIIETVHDDEKVEILDADDSGKVRMAWRGWLGQVIAHNFRCEVYWTTKYDYLPDRTETRQILKFVGMSSDVQCAKMAYVTSVMTMTRLRDQWLIKHGAEIRAEGGRWTNSDGRQASKSYIAGFIRGLKVAFAENVNKTALVLVKDPKVDEVVTTLNLRPGGRSSANYDGDFLAGNAGFHDGVDHGRTGRQQKLDGSKS